MCEASSHSHMAHLMLIVGRGSVLRPSKLSRAGSPVRECNARGGSAHAKANASMWHVCWGYCSTKLIPDTGWDAHNGSNRKSCACDVVWLHYL